MSATLSIREQAIRAIVAALGATGTPATAGVSRSRVDQIDSSSQLPCFDVTPGDERVETSGPYGDHNSVTRTLPVVVRAVVDAGAEETGATSPDDSALDPFYIFAVQQLMGSGAHLGGLVEEVREVEHKPVYRPGGRDIIGLEMTFEVEFATQRGDPTQKG